MSLIAEIIQQEVDASIAGWDTDNAGVRIAALLAEIPAE